MTISARNFLWASLAAAALFASGCGGGGGDANPAVGGGPTASKLGTVGLVITDGPMADFDQILLSISRADLIGAGGHQTIFDGPEKVFDLKRLEGDGELFALSDSVEPGTYHKIRLYVSRIALVNEGETPIEIDPPAGGKIDLNNQGGFIVQADRELLIQLDFHADMSFVKIHETGNGEYHFRPVVFVDIIGAETYGRLSRVYGAIGVVDEATGRFELCQTELLSDDDDDDDFDDDEHCLTVYVGDDTGVFSPNGDPVSFADIAGNDFATVVGMFQKDKSMSAILRKDDSENSDDDASDDSSSDDSFDDSSDDSDDDSGSDDFSDDGDDDSDDSARERDDDDFEDDHFAMKAAVVELGPKGSFESLKGRVESTLTAVPGEFGLEILKSRTRDEGSLVSALFQDGTRVFSRKGEPLDETYVTEDRVGYFDGVFTDDGDGYKTALIVLDLQREAELKLEGTIMGLSDAGFFLFTGDAEVQVCVEDNTHYFEIVNVEGILDTREIALGDLAVNDVVDVYGEWEDDGCFDADAVIVDRTGLELEPTVPLANQAPVANAGPDQTITAGEGATLDGGASRDPDNGPATLTYGWAFTSIPDGSTAVLFDEMTAMPSFTSDQPGDYIVELTVTDGELADTDSVTVTATDPNVDDPPTAFATASAAAVTTGQTVTLDGSASSDPEGAALTYAWTLATPTGSSAALSSASAVNPEFTPDVAGDYTARLVVSDGANTSAPASVTVSATEPAVNQAPTAVAAGETRAGVGFDAELNGSASSDPDGDRLSYAWTLAAPDGSNATGLLSDPASAAPTFAPSAAGDYTATLVVNDGNANSAPDAHVVTARTGATLYAENCQRCHGAGSRWSAGQIQNAIDGNRGGMRSLNFLTAGEVSAIAAALQ